MSFVEPRLCDVCTNEFDSQEKTVFDKLRNTWVRMTPTICPACVRDGVKSATEDEDVDDEDDGIEVGEVIDDEEDEIY